MALQAWHYEIWEYCQSTSKVQAYVRENLRVPGGAGLWAQCPECASLDVLP